MLFFFELLLHILVYDLINIAVISCSKLSLEASDKLYLLE